MSGFIRKKFSVLLNFQYNTTTCIVERKCEKGISNIGLQDTKLHNHHCD